MLLLRSFSLRSQGYQTFTRRRKAFFLHIWPSWTFRRPRLERQPERSAIDEYGCQRWRNCIRAVQTCLNVRGIENNVSVSLHRIFYHDLHSSISASCLHRLQYLFSTTSREDTLFILQLAKPHHTYKSRNPKNTRIQLLWIYVAATEGSIRCLCPPPTFMNYGFIFYIISPHPKHVIEGGIAMAMLVAVLHRIYFLYFLGRAYVLMYVFPHISATWTTKNEKKTLWNLLILNFYLLLQLLAIDFSLEKWSLDSIPWNHKVMVDMPEYVRDKDYIVNQIDHWASMVMIVDVHGASRPSQRPLLI